MIENAPFQLIARINEIAAKLSKDSCLYVLTKMQTISDDLLYKIPTDFVHMKLDLVNPNKRAMIDAEIIRIAVRLHDDPYFNPPEKADSKADEKSS